MAMYDPICMEWEMNGGAAGANGDGGGGSNNQYDEWGNCMEVPYFILPLLTT